MSGYRIDVDPAVNDFTHAVHRAVTTHEMVSKLGTEWRVVIERNGRPAAEIRRSRDEGLKVAFYGAAPGQKAASTDGASHG